MINTFILIKSLKSMIILQDLPEFFEDNMETWMNNFHTLLTLDNKLLQTDVSNLNYCQSL